MTSKPKRKKSRPSEEITQDRFAVLRQRDQIEPNHWVSGVAPHGCPTCNTTAAPIEGHATDDVWRDRAAKLGVGAEAVIRGVRAAEAGRLVEVAHPDMLAPESEDLTVGDGR